MMQGMNEFILGAMTTIRQRTEAAKQTILHNLQSAEQTPSPSSPLQQMMKEQVLQIDVVESGFIGKPGGLTPQKTKTQKSSSRVAAIQAQKQAILEQLKRVQDEIAEIKGQPIDDVAARRKDRAVQEQAARKQAKHLVKQLQRQKKEIEEKRRKQAEKALAVLKQEEQQYRRAREEAAERAKEEKRRVIQGRMQQEKRKREERQAMEKQSRRVLTQLKKEETVLKQKEELPSQVAEAETKHRVAEKRKEVNFRQIEEHERNYLLRKEQARQIKRDRSQSISHQPQKYHRSQWTQQLQEEDFRRKEEQKIKEVQRKNNLDKRMKYGELVKNIFLPKKKETVPAPEIEQSPASFLPKISESEKRTTETKGLRRFGEHTRPFATSKTQKHPPRPHQEPTTPDPLQQEDQKQQRKIKEVQMRKQTRERLKKLENKSLEKQQDSRPKYQNYLGKVGVKRAEDGEGWRRIAEDQKMSEEQKYSEMLRRAEQMEKRAKFKEELKKEGDQDTVNLYIGSIQAKLAILQKF